MKILFKNISLLINKMTSISFTEKKNMKEYINNKFNIIAQRQLFQILNNHNFNKFTENSNGFWITVDNLPDNILNEFYQYYKFIKDRDSNKSD